MFLCLKDVDLDTRINNRLIFKVTYYKLVDYYLKDATEVTEKWIVNVSGAFKAHEDTLKALLDRGEINEGVYKLMQEKIIDSINVWCDELGWHRLKN